MISETQPPVARRKSRPVARPTTAPRKVKTAVHLSPDAFKRLGVHCAMDGRTQSEVVEELIVAGLRKYRVQTLGHAGEAESATPVESAA